MEDRPTDGNGRSREEEIAPIRLERTDTVAPAAKAEPRRVPVMAIVGGVLVVLLFVVFFALPRWIGTATDAGTPNAAVADTGAAAEVETLTPRQIADLKSRAEDILADVLDLDQQLNDRSAPVWAPADYGTFDVAARAGDDAFLSDDFVTAIDRYTEALEMAHSLIERSNEIMTAALDAGDTAVAAGNSAFAIQQYEIVLGVDPENSRATAGIERASNLPEVLRLVRDGDRARAEGDLQVASERYREALAIDPDWAAAEGALREVTTAIANARFDTRLSAGYAALQSEEFADAAEAFTAALALRPDSTAAREGLEQAEQGIKLDAIALAEIRALAFERRELWDQAIGRYEAALETDPTLAFAVDGLERARSRADLDRKLQNLIDNARLLLDDEILEDARDLLEEAGPVADSGERIAAQTERLRQLIDAVSTPVAVRLQSDQLTQVTVYRVGPLGVFAETEIEVLPGTYTVVGSRNGYRDVRETFTVLPGRPVGPLSVVCVEPI